MNNELTFIDIDALPTTQNATSSNGLGNPTADQLTAMVALGTHTAGVRMDKANKRILILDENDIPVGLFGFLEGGF